MVSGRSDSEREAWRDRGLDPRFDAEDRNHTSRCRPYGYEVIRSMVKSYPTFYPPLRRRYSTFGR